jgi:hypothetical protein
MCLINVRREILVIASSTVVVLTQAKLTLALGEASGKIGGAIAWETPLS